MYGTPPVILPPSLYDRAEAHGFDMSGYVKDQAIPVRTDCVFKTTEPRPLQKQHYEKFRYARAR